MKLQKFLTVYCKTIMSAFIMLHFKIYDCMVWSCEQESPWYHIFKTHTMCFKILHELCIPLLPAAYTVRIRNHGETLYQTMHIPPQSEILISLRALFNKQQIILF